MYLGIDVGTSSVKAVIIDEKGAVVAQSSAALPISRPNPGWSEQNPGDWWAATNRAVSGLDDRFRSAVKGVGLSGQMHGATLLDGSDKALRPAILWNDGRSEAECGELEKAEPESRRIAGNLAMPGFTAPKILWARKHEPDVFAATKTILLPKDYVRLRMTGEKATDLSDASGTLWVDIEKRAWSPEMLAATGIDDTYMPSLHEGTEQTGSLRAELAEAWGMKKVPVVAGGGDNAAGAAGIGVVEPGGAFLSLGTSGVIFVAGDRFLPNPERAVHAFCHCLPERWHQMTVILSAASCVDWATRLAGLSDAGDLLAKVEARGSLDGGEIFLPYLSGERTPHNDPHARGVFFSLSHDTDAAALGQAVLEGVAFALADGFDALIESGAEIGSISVIGGGARSAWWGRVLSAALDRPLAYRDGSEVGPAYGAARLAFIGVTGQDPADVCVPPPVRALIEPHERDIELLAGKRAIFTKLYRNLRSLYRENEQAGRPA